MTCGHYCRRRTPAARHSGTKYRRASALQELHFAADEKGVAPWNEPELAVEVVGTWDFKWQPGSRLRVAFQLPMGANIEHCAELTRVFEVIEHHAKLWMGQPSKATAEQSVAKPSKANIELDFGGDVYRVLPARKSGEARNKRPIVEKPGEGWTSEAEPFNRSNLDARSSAAWRELCAQMRRRNGAQPNPNDVEVDFDYDILINLDPLVFSGDSTAPDEPEGRKLYMPTSELGSYARRLDYGVPSMYLGPLGAFCKTFPTSPIERLAAYYTEKTEEHHPHWHYVARAVVHEFGHALGLPHENQNPLCSTCPKDLGPSELDALRELYRTVLDIDAKLVPNFEEVMRNQFIPWPDNLDFSDWDAHTHAPDAPSESVMTTVHSVFVELGAPNPSDARFTEFLRKTGPSDVDLKRLRYMYGEVSEVYA